MIPNTLITSRFEELIIEGESVVKTRQSPPANSIGFDSSVNSEMAYKWVTSVQNLVGKVFGDKSVYSNNIISSIGNKSVTYSPSVKILGVLKSAKEDYEKGLLFEIKDLVAAELFSDFLDQAEYLIDSGYFAPAAVIVGAVLEDALRNLCTKHGIALGDRPKLDTMNNELAKLNLYNLLTKKQITAHADLRNKAAHGRWSEFVKVDVEAFLEWTKNFLERYAV